MAAPSMTRGGMRNDASVASGAQPPAPGAAKPPEAAATDAARSSVPAHAADAAVLRIMKATRRGEFGVALRLFRTALTSGFDRRLLLQRCNIVALVPPGQLTDGGCLCDLIDVALMVDADDAAETASRRLLAVRSGDVASAYCDIAKIYFSRFRYREALMAATAARRLDMDSETIAFFIGVVYQHFGWFSAAAEVYSALIGSDSRHLGAMICAGVCYSALGDIERAIGLFETALALDAANEVAASNLIMCLCAAGRIARAESLLREFARRASGAFPVTLLQAVMLERRGRPSEAVDLLEALVASSACAPLLVTYGRCVKQLDEHDVATPRRARTAIATIESWKRRGAESSSVSEQRSVNFILGDLHDRNGDYDQAFRCYREANALLPPGFDRQPARDLLRSIEAARIDIAPRHSTDTARDLIFIVGMPRSGTSLLEQIITTSPHAYGAGERPTIGRIAWEISGGSLAAYPSALENLSAEKLSAYAGVYLEQFDGIARNVTIVDKMPTNFQFLGLIGALLPGAKIIHMRRDWRDTCLSCYCHEFSGKHPYKYRLADLGFYYRIHEEMMTRWRDIFGGRIATVRYEDLVSCLDDVVRDVFDFLGIDVPADYRNFHLSARPCLTASYQEVRKPLYSTSIGRWRKYEKHLSELHLES